MNNKKKVTLCVTTMDSRYGKYPIEIKFPEGLIEHEKKRIEMALERTIKDLGYDPLWIPLF